MALFSGKTDEQILSKLAGIETAIKELTSAIKESNKSTPVVSTPPAVATKKPEKPRAERLSLTAKDWQLVTKWAGGSGFTADVAANVKRQNWISPKQREILERDGKDTRRRGLAYHDVGDYDMEDDMDQAFAWGIDGWGDND